MPRKRTVKGPSFDASTAPAQDSTVTLGDTERLPIEGESVSIEHDPTPRPPSEPQSLPRSGGSLPAQGGAVRLSPLAALANGSHPVASVIGIPSDSNGDSNGSHLTGPISEGYVPLEALRQEAEDNPHAFLGPISGEGGELRAPLGSAVDLYPVGKSPSLRRVRARATQAFYNRIRVAESIADNPLAEPAARLRALDILGKFGPGMSEEAKTAAPLNVQVLAAAGAVIHIRGKR